MNGINGFLFWTSLAIMLVMLGCGCHIENICSWVGYWILSWIILFILHDAGNK